MVGKNENILVEFDYNNITIIDPNKVIDDEGKAMERNVRQEDLVFYANLECKVLPRTKLAVGVANNDAIQTVSVATINFLKQGNKEFLDTSYTDEITGKDTIKGDGVNQVKQTKVDVKGKDPDSFIRQTLLTGGKAGAQDNGLLGITNITIRQGLDFLPVIDVQLEDVKGRALFEGGDNSPYAAFFNLPYPLFHLTLKGYYGKAIKLGLMLHTFNSRYDTYSGNFKIDLKFYTYKYTILNEVSMGYLLAVPHMYKSRVQIQPTTNTDNNSQFVRVQDGVVERGYQKIKEVYSEYKSKGLIPDNFPEITIVQMKERINNFLKNEMDKFTKQNLNPLTDLNTFQTDLNDYKGYVYYYTSGTEKSWFETYMDKKTPLVLTNGIKIYTFKKEYNNQAKSDARAKLKELVNKYNTKLEENKTLGVKGQYKINGQLKNVSINGSIKYDTDITSTQINTFRYPYPVNRDDVDLKATYKIVTGLKTEPSEAELIEFEGKLIKEGALSTTVVRDENGNPERITEYFYFETPTTTTINNLSNQRITSSFIDKIDDMGKQLKEKRLQIEDELTKALAEFIQSGQSGIGFVPNVRNVLAVLFASGEAFLRLMDDVHTTAWNVNDNDEGRRRRRDAVLKPETQGASQDNIDSGANGELPIYPWPQVLKLTTGNDGHELYEIAYPGEPDLIGQTNAFVPEIWPEVQFVEEFIYGLTERDALPINNTATQNELTEPQRVTLNAIEFPISNEVFANKEEVKFFYEIYERVLFTTYYSRLLRSGNFIADSDKISNIIADAETINLIKSLSNDNPFLIEKLKNLPLRGNNFETVLRHISNNGTGESWQNFIRGIFNTRYIKNKVQNSSFQFISPNVLDNSLGKPLVSLPTEDDFVDYITNSTTSNTFDFADTYPFTDAKWDKKYLANGVSLSTEKDSFDTRKILTYNPINKIITNVTSYDGGKKPFTQFLGVSDVKIPTGYKQSEEIKTFYYNRSLNLKEQLITEGNLKYRNYTGDVGTHQTVSMLNTPYYVNAIQKGIENFRNYEKYPFVEAAYLFLNSLPLSTLREKYRTINDSDDLNYIFATLKKFGAVHKLPYSWILKYGSIWHRYKKYIEEGVDIMDSVWNQFNYVKNFDPETEDINKVYTFSAGTSVGVIDMLLQKNITIGSETSTTINAGFYPKVINDFNVFYQGFEIFSAYTSTAFEESLNSGFTINYVDEAIIKKQEGFDPNDPNRDLRIFPWTVYVKSFDNKSTYLMPSQGSLINQTEFECFKNGKLNIEVLGNQSIYDGSIRSFWAAPNYGYYNSNKVAKPQPIQYIKEIFSGQAQQENFSINGEITGYTQISEMFSVFEKSVLDLFEEQFLEFSKSKYEFNSTSGTTDNTMTSKSYKNFQMLMTEIMRIDSLTGDTGTKVVEEAQLKQLKVLNDLLVGFLNSENLIIKYGNPSQFDKRLFYTFSNYEIVDPYTLEKYTVLTPNALPVSGGTTTLSISKTQYPNEWKALETYVGFSEIPELVYENNGSYITDFFIDMNIAFSVDNIKNFAPIIKIYATQKLKDDTLNLTKFTNLMDEYIESTFQFKNKVIDNLVIKMQKELPVIKSNNQSLKQSKINDDAIQTKVELWESFKALNDKWIAGTDFKTKTLFEDVLLLDRASRNIGEKVIVNIEKLSNRLENINVKTSMLTFAQTILVENNFVVMNLPSYVNFYNVQDAIKNPIPRSEGTLEFANTMFGTFLNVDYRNSSAKMVCFFGGKPSEQLDMKNNVDFRYRNDSFELRRASNNPLVEDLSNKQDWDKSNKVVGFNVDIGPQNQSIFYGFQVSQNSGKATAESLEVLNEMANQSRNRGGSTQNVSLYNLYKNRSYSCTVSMMGNAMVQPTMYFNLRYVPMFHGPYMITNVSHTITPGNFETIVEGIRQPVAALPKLDNYLQSLKTNLLDSIKKQMNEDKKQKEIGAKNTNSDSNIDNQKAGVQNDLTSKDSSKANSSITQECEVLQAYSQYTPQTNPNTTVSTVENMVRVIRNKTTDEKLRYVVFASATLGSGTGTEFRTCENNYFSISLSPKRQTQKWGGSLDGLFSTSKTYYCSTANISYATFDSIDDSVTFIVSKWNQLMGGVEITKESIAKFLILNQSTSTKRKEEVYTTYDPTQRADIEKQVQKAIDTYKSIP